MPKANLFSSIERAGARAALLATEQPDREFCVLRELYGRYSVSEYGMHAQKQAHRLVLLVRKPPVSR